QSPPPHKRLKNRTSASDSSVYFMYSVVKRHERQHPLTFQSKIRNPQSKIPPDLPSRPYSGNFFHQSRLSASQPTKILPPPRHRYDRHRGSDGAKPSRLAAAARSEASPEASNP